MNVEPLSEISQSCHLSSSYTSFTICLFLHEFEERHKPGISVSTTLVNWSNSQMCITSGDLPVLISTLYNSAEETYHRSIFILNSIFMTFSAWLTISIYSEGEFQCLLSNWTARPYIAIKYLPLESLQQISQQVFWANVNKKVTNFACYFQSID